MINLLYFIQWVSFFNFLFITFLLIERHFWFWLGMAVEDCAVAELVYELHENSQ